MAWRICSTVNGMPSLQASFRPFPLLDRRRVAARAERKVDGQRVEGIDRLVVGSGGPELPRLERLQGGEGEDRAARRFHQSGTPQVPLLVDHAVYGDDPLMTGAPGAARKVRRVAGDLCGRRDVRAGWR